MNAQSKANLLISLLSLWGLLFFWLKMYPSLRIEEFRQSLFELRDRMFDMAARGELSFSDEAYVVLRTTINGMIADADTVTLLGLFTQVYLYQKYVAPQDRLNPLQGAIAHSPRESRPRYAALKTELSDNIIDFALKRQLLVYGLARSARFILQALSLQKPARAAKRRIRDGVVATEGHAFLTGSSRAAGLA